MGRGSAEGACLLDLESMTEGDTLLKECPPRVGLALASAVCLADGRLATDA